MARTRLDPARPAAAAAARSTTTATASGSRSRSHLSSNHAADGGGAIFFVSNDRTGTLAIKDSALQHNRSDGFQTAGLPGIYFLGAGRPAIVDSVLR